jgi:hypothetical protein
MSVYDWKVLNLFEKKNYPPPSNLQCLHPLKTTIGVAMSLFCAKIIIIIKILLIKKKLENMKKAIFLEFCLLFFYFFIFFFWHKMTLQQLKVREHCKLLGKYTFSNFFSGKRRSNDMQHMTTNYKHVVNITLLYYKCCSFCAHSSLFNLFLFVY